VLVLKANAGYAQAHASQTKYTAVEVSDAPIPSSSVQANLGPPNLIAKTPIPKGDSRTLSPKAAQAALPAVSAAAQAAERPASQLRPGGCSV